MSLVSRVVFGLVAMSLASCVVPDAPVLQVANCATGRTACNGECVDLATDSSNCGACGRVCGADQACRSGECDSSCPADHEMCGDLCVDLASNSSHCGACGQSCSGDEECRSGECCPPAELDGECTPSGCGCGGGETCYPTSDPDEHLACFESDGLEAGEACGGQYCNAGLGCFGGICRPYCDADEDCPEVGGVQSCRPTFWSGDVEIAGVQVCSWICDPAQPQDPRPPLLPCPEGFGCVSAEDGATGCRKIESAAEEGAECEDQGDCAPGLYCSAGSTCHRYCLTSFDCLGGVCDVMDPPQLAGNHDVGYCRDAETDREAAALDFATRYCGKMADCAPGVLSLHYGTLESCVGRLAALNQWFALLDGVAWEPSDFAACADAWEARSCAGFNEQRRPDVCELVGTREVGEACQDNAQCASGFCASAGFQCGECAAASEPGAACVNGACPLGQWCVDDTCILPGEAGDSCTTNGECLGGLACDSGVCGPKPGQAGDACAHVEACDWYHGVVCDVDNDVCVELGIAAAGEACGWDDDGRWVVCTTNGRCVSGTCEPAPSGPGGECDASANQYCVPPAWCVSGECRLPDPGESC